MPIREILRAVVFVHRVADDKDLEEVINCIPDERMKDLEVGLKQRQTSGELDLVQIGRHRTQATSFTEYNDQIDWFLALIDEVKLPAVFTGFDNINETLA